MTALRFLPIVAFSASLLLADDPGASLKVGKAELQSAGVLAFGPQGILFVADPKGAAIFALATGDKDAAAPLAAVNVAGIDEKIAAALGTKADQLLVNDFAIHPGSGRAYLSVSRGKGPDAIPVIVRVGADGKIDALDLERIAFSKAALPNPPAVQSGDAKGGGKGRRAPDRMDAITDIAFVEGELLVAGLSNEEFASTLRSIPFPFKDVSKGASIEIYHGAHGALETHSPVRTFVPFRIGGQPHLFAAYTCTPLVTFPLAELKPGAKVRGKTIAELGNRNRPLDMLAYKKGDKDYLLIANNSRGVMKVSTDGVAAASAINEPVRGGGTQGVPYETVADWKGIEQLDSLDAERVVVVRRGEKGTLDVETLALP